MTLRTQAFGAASVCARGFTFGGRGHLTVIVKAAGTFDPETGEVTLRSEPFIVNDERTVRDNPLGSLEHASDIALFVPSAEVLVTGVAHALGEQAVSEMTVGLELLRAGHPVLSKSLKVTGDRRGAPGTQPDPAPFTQMPIVYERSFGGMTNRSNPVGVGEEVGADRMVKFPNFSPADGKWTEYPAGFGPIASVWPLRRARRGALSHADAHGLSWIELPQGFDQSFFQAGPPDQWTGDIWGGDVVLLHRMNAELETMRLVVPYYQAAAMLALPRGERRLLSLRLDTVFISAASQSCEFLFRTNTPFDRRDWDQSVVAGAIHPLGIPFVFPDRLDPTGGVDDNAINRPRTFQGTEILEPQGGGQFGSIADLKRHSEPPPTAVIPQEQKFSSTVVVELEAAPQSLPFAARTRQRSTRSAEAPPGSPWARPSATSAPPAIDLNEPADPLGATVNLPDGPAKPEDAPLDLPPKLEQPLPVISRSEEPAPPKQPVPKAGPLWREDPPAPVAPKAAPPPAAPKADLSKHLYKKIKR